MRSQCKSCRSLAGLAWLGGRSLALDCVWSWGWCVGWSWNEVGACVWGVSNSRNYLKVKWERKWFYGLARNIFGQIENIFSLTLFLGGAKHGPRCKIFSGNHLHPKQTQPKTPIKRYYIDTRFFFFFFWEKSTDIRLNSLTFTFYLLFICLFWKSTNIDI